MAEDRSAQSAADREAADRASGTAWELENSPYTVEGEIEGAQRFATGVRYARGWKRGVGIGLVIMFLAPFAFGLLRAVRELFF